MGRITIFSADGCPHSRRAKAALKKHDIPFVEIFITRYPKKREDMIALCDRMATPQVFFNTRHVGGADETIALLKKWDEDKSRYPTPLDRYEAEIGKHPDPSNKRFDIPDYPPVEPEPSPARGDAAYAVTLPDGTKATVLATMETLKKILPITDLSYNMTVYANSMTGASAVEALKEHYDMNEEEAIAFGRQLQDLKMIHHVTNDHQFGEPQYYFRLQCHHTPNVLNSYRVWSEDADPDCMRLLNRLKRQMATIESSVTDDDGMVDYVQVCQCPEFLNFEEDVCELQKVDLASLDETTKKAFGIILYNLMIKYAFVKVGVPETSMARSAFFSDVSFNVGGLEFSFQDWEHGIMRGNQKPPHGISAPFAKKDPRIKLIVQQPDYRFHFGLNCGAKSCPPVNQYSVEHLESEMRIIAETFCEEDSNVSFDRKGREVQLSKIFSWYRPDFAGSNDELFVMLLNHLRGVKRQTLERMIYDEGTLKVTYKKYDWSTNAKRYIGFDPVCLKANHRSVKALLSKKDEHSTASPRRQVNVRVQDSNARS